MSREVSENGKSLIKEFEGLRLTKYNDIAGNSTIGWGHMVQPGENIPDTITQEQCETLFEKDLAHAGGIVEQLVTVALTDNQFSALVSFVFNLGGDALRRSTLLKKLNAGDYADAANEFDKWVYAGGEPSDGLERRRDAEKSLFLT